mmetsp:Transcript_82539/g.224165  ORF Transcript_82539/g.224165 Transcript_82539/m.224165 type:complete len:235 (+) Transcript_82539:449-1153(+)
MRPWSSPSERANQSPSSTELAMLAVGDEQDEGCASAEYCISSVSGVPEGVGSALGRACPPSSTERNVEDQRWPTCGWLGADAPAGRQRVFGVRNRAPPGHNTKVSSSTWVSDTVWLACRLSKSCRRAESGDNNCADGYSSSSPGPWGSSRGEAPGTGGRNGGRNGDMSDDRIDNGALVVDVLFVKDTLVGGFDEAGGEDGSSIGDGTSSTAAADDADDRSAASNASASPVGLGW